MRQPGGRRPFIVAGAVTAALLVLLFPPWRARAIRSTTRYAAASGVAPSTVVDTIAWNLGFAPLYAPPGAALTGDQMRALAMRSLAGDIGARAELRRAADVFERRYHAPEALRTTGALWRDSVLAAAGIPSVTSYEPTFALDQRWIAARLAVIAGVGLFLYRRERLRLSRPS